MRPPAAAAAIAVLIAAALAAPASAAVKLTPCPGGGEARCGRVTVPLDRTGAVPGTVSLRVMRLAARSAKPAGTLFAEAGGPGDGAIEYFTRRADVLATVRDRWNVVVVDQRGTGDSGLVTCAGLQSGQDPAVAVPACAAQLGARRSLYTTAASADDLDAVRAALGLKTISYYGLSYGTWLGQTYAVRHRSRLDRMVLDGVVSIEQQDDPFSTGLFAALPRVLRATCGGRACTGITKDPWADLLALAKTLAAGPVSGTRIDDRGRPQTQGVSIPLTALALVGADLNGDLRAQFPAAIRRAVDGDPTLLLRVVEAGNVPAASPASRFSVGVNTATGCEEKGMPWERTTPLDERPAEAQRRLEQIPPSTFRPIDRALVLAFGLPPVCRYWPNAPADPLERRKLPDVPTLLLDGDADLRTLLENAKAVARRLPRSQVVTVPNVGHNTLSSAFTDCARRALATFLGGARARRCGATAFRAVPPPPAKLGSTQTARVAAAVLTVDDAVAQGRLRLRQVSAPKAKVLFGGLLGGTTSDDGSRVVLAGARVARLGGAQELVKGLTVTGTVTVQGTGTVTLGGTVKGSLAIGSRRVTGTLDGAKVDVARPSSAYRQG